MDGTHRHIAIFIYALTGGGAQRRTLTLVNAFAGRGHRVDLVVVRPDGELNHQLSPSVRLVALDSGWGRLLPFVSRWIPQRGMQTAASTLALSQYLKRVRPDVIMSAASHVNLVSVLARRLARVRVPLVLRASNHPSGNSKLWPAAARPIRVFLRWMAGRVYPWADAVIAVSGGVAEEIAQLTGLSRKTITTIYNPTVTADLADKAGARVDHPWLAAGQPPVILGAGKLKIQKDFPTLIRAFARVRATRPARLVILGEGGQRRTLEALARKLGVADDVAMPGHVDNPLAWMRAASVFALSSAWEGLPGVLIEAMACGCPVVSTDCPSGPAEILDCGEYGPLVPVADEQALAEAIGATLDRPTDPEKLRERVAMFSVEPAVDRYLEVLLGQAAIADRLSDEAHDDRDAAKTGVVHAGEPRLAR